MHVITDQQMWLSSFNWSIGHYNQQWSLWINRKQKRVTTDIFTELKHITKILIDLLD